MPEDARTQHLARWVTSCALLLAALKLAVAASLGLYPDEAFYWQCAQRLDVAYADVPPLTALLVRLGTEVFGDTSLGVRAPFLLLGTLFPFVVQRLALPRLGAEGSWAAAGLSLSLPGLAYQGVVAIPDGPLLFLTACFLWASDRATSGEGRASHWLWAGAIGALGLTCHYRFVLAPAALALYLLLTPRGRRLLRTGGPWLTLGLLCVGLLPALIYNVQHGFAPLRYHLGARHGGGVNPGALWRFAALQALIVSPLLFPALIAALVRVVRDGRRGRDRAALFACFGGLPLALFFLASPLETSGLATGHWPAPAYVALLVPLVPTLGSFARGSRARRGLAAAAVGLGATVMVLAGVELLFDVVGASSKRPFVGWDEATRAAEERLPAGALVVADNYKLAAELEFESAGRLKPFVLDHPKNHRHGRAPQLAAWGIDEPALRRQAGRDALVVIQVKELPSAEREAWRARIASLFRELRPLGGEVRRYVGKRSVRFAYYRGVRLLGE